VSTQFSQADPRVVQVAATFEVAAGKIGKAAEDLRRYADVRAKPGNFVERFARPDLTVATGVVFEEDLGYPVHSVMLDNPTFAWLLLEVNRRWIPPYTLGWVIPVFAGSPVIRVTLGPPPGGFANNGTKTGQFVYLGFSESFLPPMTGFLAPGAPA
jgi:hypothetical protein